MNNSSRSGNRRRRFWIALAALCGLLASGVAVRVGSQVRQGSSRSLLSTPTIDPQLIVHARTVPVRGTLGGAAVLGTLYPGLPGPNTVRLTIRGLAKAGGSPYLTLKATMPGMHMVPVVARLQPRHDTYSGEISLLMFGTYAAEIAIGQGAAARHGTVQLNLPLSLGH